MRKRVSVGIMLVIAMIGQIVAPLFAQDGGPSFQILQPMPDQLVTGGKMPIAIAFQSTDETPVVRFDAYLNNTWLIGGRIKNPIANGNFRVDADLASLKVSSGYQTLHIKLYDNLGRVTQRDLRVKVDEPSLRQIERNPPKVRIVSPKDGDKIAKKTDIKVDASDDTGIKWVMIYVNGQMRAMMNESPFQLPWDPVKDKLPMGMYTITARALDLFDNEAQSLPVMVQVLDPNFKGRVYKDEPEIDAVSDLLSLPVIVLPNPSIGATTPRAALPSLIPAFNDWIASTLLPATAMQPREYGLSAASDNLFALLPPKALPGQQETHAIAAITGMQATTAPALAMLPGRLDRTTLGAVVLTPMRGGMLLPTEVRPGADRATQTDMPILLVMQPALEKGKPTEDTRSTRTPQVPLMSVNDVTAPTAGASATRLMPGQPALIVRTGEITLTDVRADMARALPTDTPVLIALIPDTQKRSPNTARSSATDSALRTDAVRSIDGPVTGRTSDRTALQSSSALAGARSQALPAAKISADTREALASQPILIALIPTLEKRMPAATAAEARTAAIGDTTAVLSPNAGTSADRTAVTHTPHQPIARTTVDPALQSGAAREREQATPTPDQLADLPVKISPILLVADLPSRTEVKGRQTQIAPTPGDAGARMISAPSARHTTDVTAPALASIAPDRQAIMEHPAIAVASLPGKVSPEGQAAEASAAPVALAPVVGVTPAATENIAALPATAEPASMRHAGETPVMEVEVPYLVQQGDTLEKIARANNTTPEELVKLNPSLSPERPLPVAQRIVVPQDEARIYLDNEPLAGAPEPYIVNGYTMVPLRQLVEAKGGMVVWLPQTKEVNAWVNQTFMGVQLGSTDARINAQRYTLPVAPDLKEARTMVPLRYMMAALKLQVVYNPENGTYFLVSQAVP